MEARPMFEKLAEEATANQQMHATRIIILCDRHTQTDTRESTKKLHARAITMSKEGRSTIQLQFKVGDVQCRKKDKHVEEDT